MFKPFQYPKFLFTATNQHGVHSPFVYKYVTKCLYSKPDYPYSKSVNVLLKSIAYFDVKQVGIPENPDIKKIVLGYFPNLGFDEKRSEILCLSASDQKLLSTVLSEENTIQNDSMLLIDSIYGDRYKNKVWNKVKMHEKVSVTIDMFHCGAVFFRQEQANEHFKIRI